MNRGRGNVLREGKVQKEETGIRKKGRVTNGDGGRRGRGDYIEGLKEEQERRCYERPEATEEEGKEHKEGIKETEEEEKE
jgi:hypothetical protein